MSDNATPSRRDRLIEAVFGAKAVRVATWAHIGIVVPLIGTNVVNLLTGSQLYGNDATFVVNMSTILVSAFFMAHVMVASHLRFRAMNRAAKETEEDMKELLDTLRAQIEAQHHRLRAEAEGRPHAH